MEMLLPRTIGEVGPLWPAGLEGASGSSPAGGGGGRDDGGTEAARVLPEPGSGRRWVAEVARDGQLGRAA